MSKHRGKPSLFNLFYVKYYLTFLNRYRYFWKPKMKLKFSKWTGR